MSHKEMAIAFLQQVAVGDIKAAYEKFIAPHFIHHNQYFKGDRQSLLEAMEEAHKMSPNKALDVKQAYEEGDNVIIHSRVIRQNPNDADIVVIHIFRFENHQVVELWDVGQEIIKNSPNKNGLF